MGKVIGNLITVGGCCLVLEHGHPHGNHDAYDDKTDHDK
jgi:hypothetical protein